TVLLQLWACDSASAGCIVVGSTAFSGKGALLHGKGFGSSARKSQGSGMSLTGRRSRCAWRGHCRPPLGREIVLRGGPLEKPTVLCRRRNSLRRLNSHTKRFHRIAGLAD